MCFSIIITTDCAIDNIGKGWTSRPIKQETTGNFKLMLSAQSVVAVISTSSGLKRVSSGTLH